MTAPLPTPQEFADAIRASFQCSDMDGDDMETSDETLALIRLRDAEVRRAALEEAAVKLNAYIEWCGDECLEKAQAEIRSLPAKEPK